MGPGNVQAPCLKVKKTLGEKAIQLASEMSLLSHDLKIDQVNDHLCIPLTSEPHIAEMERLTESLSNLEVEAAHLFSERAKQHVDLSSLLQDKLPAQLLASLPHAIDFVGTIAIVEIPPELNDHKTAIGEAILTMNRHLHTVLAKAGAVDGVYRVRKLETIAGAEGTQTIHREFGCIFHVDLSKAYFSPRLSHEHFRVASQIVEPETIIDMFAGVGPFSIMIAKRNKNAKVYAIDINPDAVDYLRRNIVENRVVENVEPILGDARQIIEEKLAGIADRAIMNLPEKAIEYVDAASRALKSEGGVLHFYAFEGGSEPLESATVRLTAAVKQAGRKVGKILASRLVRATSPFVWQVAVDAEIS